MLLNTMTEFYLLLIFSTFVTFDENKFMLKLQSHSRIYHTRDVHHFDLCLPVNLNLFTQLAMAVPCPLPPLPSQTKKSSFARGTVCLQS